MVESKSFWSLEINLYCHYFCNWLFFICILHNSDSQPEIQYKKKEKEPLKYLSYLELFPPSKLMMAVSCSSTVLRSAALVSLVTSRDSRQLWWLPWWVIEAWWVLGYCRNNKWFTKDYFWIHLRKKYLTLVILNVFIFLIQSTSSSSNSW